MCAISLGLSIFSLVLGLIFLWREYRSRQRVEHYRAMVRHPWGVAPQCESRRTIQHIDRTGSVPKVDFEHKE